MGNRNSFAFRKQWGMRLTWITEQLEERGLTQRELGEAIGLSEVQVSKVLRGGRKLSADEADAIRRFFGYRLPDDPILSDADRIHDYLSRLGVAQRRAVVLYLEALSGEPQEQHRAS